MAQKKISQIDARAAIKRVSELEEILDRQCNRWAGDCPLETNIGSVRIHREMGFAIATARLLKHAVVVTVGDGSEIDVVKFYALKAGEAK
jgi:hypothetical protein